MRAFKKIAAAAALAIPLIGFTGGAMAQDGYRGHDRYDDRGDRHDGRGDRNDRDWNRGNDRRDHDRHDEKSPREIRRILADNFPSYGNPVRVGDEYYANVQDRFGKTFYVKVNAYNGYSRFIDRREYYRNAGRSY